MACYTAALEEGGERAPTLCNRSLAALKLGERRRRRLPPGRCPAKHTVRFPRSSYARLTSPSLQAYPRRRWRTQRRHCSCFQRQRSASRRARPMPAATAPSGPSLPRPSIARPRPCWPWAACWTASGHTGRAWPPAAPAPSCTPRCAWRRSTCRCHGWQRWAGGRDAQPTRCWHRCGTTLHRSAPLNRPRHVAVLLSSQMHARHAPCPPPPPPARPAQYWAAHVEEAQAPNPLLSARDGRLIKPVPRAQRLAPPDLQAHLEAALYPLQDEASSSCCWVGRGGPAGGRGGSGSGQLMALQGSTC